MIFYFLNLDSFSYSRLSECSSQNTSIGVQIDNFLRRHSVEDSVVYRPCYWHVKKRVWRESNLWKVNWVLSSGWLLAHALWTVEQRERRSPAASKVKALGFRAAIVRWWETNRRLRSADHSHWPLWPCEATTRSVGSAEATRLRVGQRT